jgi:photosystem II stability/assembly factor-like uncharacterized protein
MKRQIRSLLIAAALLGCLLASAPAWGNGRFPFAQLLLVDPSNPDRLWLRATYGVLTSADRGCTWHWLCEGAVGYRGTEDPMFGVMADGSVIAGIFDGMVATRDYGCTWSYGGSGVNVVDLAVQKSDPSRAVAVTSNYVLDSYLNHLWRTTDSARTWFRVGPALDTDMFFITVDTAPSDPRRIYATAKRFILDDGGVASSTTSVWLRSDDDGQSWQRSNIPGTGEDFDAYLSAVHPTEPQRVYVRLRGKDDVSAVVNRVIYSSDGGQSWQQIFEARADVLGFALSPDGSRIALGLGDSRDLGRTRPVDPSVLGLYSASTADHQFALRRSGHIGCLTWSDQGLYLCAAGYPGANSDPFEVGLTNDEGVTNTKIMRLAGIEGPLDCLPETTVGQMCADRSEQSEWQRTCKLIGRCDSSSGELRAYPRGETCPPGSNGTGGASNTPDGGTPVGGAPDGGPSAAPDALRIDKGCSVSLPGRRSGAALVALLALGLLAARRRGQRNT